MEESSQTESNAFECCGKVGNKQMQNEFCSYYKHIAIKNGLSNVDYFLLIEYPLLEKERKLRSW